MRIELEYNAELDSAVFMDHHVNLRGDEYHINAATVAGRATPDARQKPNEDAFSIAMPEEGGLEVGVFDGASSQKPIPELDGVSGARFASHSLKELFIRRPRSQSIAIALAGLNSAFGDRLRAFPSVDYEDANSLPTSTATIGVLRRGRLHVGHVGDTFGAVLFEDGTTRLVTNNLHRRYDEKVLGLIEDIALEDDITPLEARADPRVRAAIMEMFQDTRNRPDGTGEGMVNGDPNMTQYIHKSSVLMRGVRAVLLGSDGLVPPGMSEQNPADRERMFDIVRQDGVRGLIHLAHSVQDADPDRWLVRYKHSDDATGVLIEIS